MEARLSFHRRLGVQMGLAVALLVGLAFGATGVLLVGEQREVLTRELTLRTLAETRSLALAASAPLLRHDPELGLHPFILKALEETPDLVDLQVVDAQGTVQGHRDLLQVGKRAQPSGQRRPLVLPLRAGERAWLDGDDVVLEQPILHLGQPIGSLVARAGRAGIEATVHAAQRKMTVVAAAGTLLAIAAVVLLVTLSLRPLAEMRHGMALLGAGDLSARVRVRGHNELGLLSQLVNSMAVGLEKAQHRRLKQERIEHELQIARQLQDTLLPRATQAPAGYELFARYAPALEVSGDYYDFIAMDTDRLAVVVADVSGKGVPGLVVMAMLRMILRGLASTSRDPATVLAAASNMLAGSMRRGMFVTCFYGVLDAHTNELIYASAGHCPPLLFGAGPPRFLEAGGKAIGMFPQEVFQRSLQCREVRLRPGEGLLLYTDGLVECMDPAGSLLGADAVAERVADMTRLDAPAVVSEMFALAARHAGTAAASDDLTVVALRRLPVAMPAMGPAASLGAATTAAATPTAAASPAGARALR